MSIEDEGGSGQHPARPIRTPEERFPYEDEINLLDYWKVIWVWRLMIAGLFMITVFTTMVVLLNSPKIYKSTVTMMPSGQNQGDGLTLLGGGNAMLQGILSGVTSLGGDTVMALLQSRVLAEDIAKHFDLVTLFHVETVHDAASALQGMMEIKNEEGVIAITVEAEDPNLAADLANYYVKSLDHMNQSMSLTATKRNRVFIEERMAEAIKELEQAELNIKNFQLKNMTVFLNEQVAGSMNEAGKLQSQITSKEVEMKVRGSYLRLQHPDLVRLKLELEQLREKLGYLETGGGGDGQLPGKRLYPAWISVPDLAIEFGQYTRELETKEEVYKLLTTQLEQAKIAEVKDDPTVEVLDAALPPGGPSKPQVKLAMLISGVLSLFVGVILAFVMDYVKRMSARPEETVLS